MDKKQEKEMKKYLAVLSKDALINLYLQKDFELNMAENLINNLELMVDKRDQQINELKDSLKEHKIIKYECKITKDDVKRAIDDISNMESYNEMFRQIEREIFEHARRKAIAENKTMGQIYAEITGKMSIFGLDLKKERKRHDKSRMVIDIKTE